MVSNVDATALSSSIDLESTLNVQSLDCIPFVSVFSWRLVAFMASPSQAASRASGKMSFPIHCDRNTGLYLGVGDGGLGV